MANQKSYQKIDKSETRDVEPKIFSQPRHNRKPWHSDKPSFRPQRFNNYLRKSNQKKQTLAFKQSESKL